MSQNDTQNHAPKLWQALIPVVALIGLIATQLLVFQGDPQIALVLACLVTAIVGKSIGCPWTIMEKGMIDGIVIGLKSILILMTVGIMIGVWIAAGVAPIMIDYGLQTLSPKFFLVATCLICSVVSLATGSSWTTAGAVGVALIGIGEGLDIPKHMVAGAIVSGAYFGDKMSPLSDSTNLAPAVAGSDLFEHIRHMTQTTGPAWGFALILYLGIGLFNAPPEGNLEAIQNLQSSLRGTFNMNPILLTAPIFVIVLVMLGAPALPTLLFSSIYGGLLAILVQGASMGEVLNVAHYGYEATTSEPNVNELLSAGGLDSMMFTVSLILCALAFGGLMESAGMLKRLADAAISWARNAGQLITASIATSIGLNILAPDQYLSIIGSGRMYRNAYKERGLHPKNLSRALEDGGTMTSPLVPWNTCGAFMYETLGVFPLAYLPFAFVNTLTPLIAIGFAIFGVGIVKLQQTAPSPGPLESKSDAN